MRVIGKQGSNYICVISHMELEKATNNFYGKLHELRDGDELDIGYGYDFRQDLRQAAAAITHSVEKFESTRNKMIEVLKVIPKEET